MSSGIFISYRRKDTSGQAGRLYDRLVDRFGSDNVFMDVDTIRLGADFTRAIDEAVSSCVVLLAVIGPDWSQATKSDGMRRLEDPNDFVRLEIETALNRSVTVVPVLVRGAAIPGEAELPEEIGELARHEATELSDTRFNYDVGHLIAKLEVILRASLGEEPPQSRWGRLIRAARRPRFVGVFVIVVALFLTAVAAFLDKQPPAIEEDLAFLSDRTGNTETFATNVGGVAWKQLTTDQSHQVRANPSLGEDGIVNASEFRPDWSPDGRRIVFASEHDGPRDLYIMNANGTGLTRLTNNDAIEAAPDWHPYSEKIAYFVHSDQTTEEHPRSAIWVIDLKDPMDPVQLTSDRYLNRGPDWSPDGERIAFVNDSDGDPDIIVMDADRSNRRRITHTDSVEFQPAWSPDGEKIAFEGEEEGDIEIFVMESNGDARSNLTSNGAHDQLPTWSPTGRQIAYASDADGDFDIFIVDTDGSNGRNVTENTDHDSAPAWRPES